MTERLMQHDKCDIFKVNVVGDLPRATVLWRYLSLDKLIHLLDQQALFMTPLLYYAKTDPFEGYLPKVMVSTLGDALNTQFLRLSEELANLEYRAKSVNQGSPQELAVQNQIADLKTDILKVKEHIAEAYKKVAKGTVVNCWHESLCESEGMWKLYSDSNKGVAIKTTVARLIDAIEQENRLDHLCIGRVKYIDFFDSSLTVSDCLVGGHSSPLLKRLSFSHENEIRLFMVPQFQADEISVYEPNHFNLKIDINTLIQEIIISPFAAEPFISSTKAICKKYGLQCSVSQSVLMSGHEELVNLFDFTTLRAERGSK